MYAQRMMSWRGRERRRDGRRARTSSTESTCRRRLALNGRGERGLAAIPDAAHGAGAMSV